MEQHEVELAVGDILRLGLCTMTVMDIDGAEVTFRLDEDQPDEPPASPRRPLPPR
jgi:hypothetical protein